MVEIDITETPSTFCRVAETMSSPSILIIDDDENLLSMLVMVFKQKGFSIRSAQSGEAGIEMALEEVPDVILCDVEMKGIGGFGALARLRQEEKTAEVPFIFLTGLATPATRRMAFAMGVSDFLSKPYLPSELLETVQRCLKGNRN